MMVTHIEEQQERQFSKFQPVRDGTRISGLSRVYLEYDGESGEYVELDPVSGTEVERGFIERPVKELPERNAA